MDRVDYKSKWKEAELNKFTRVDFEGLTVDEATIQFLTDVGLPDNAAPFVAFDRKELRTIEQIYSTGNPADKFLIDIGFDGAGDPICIDVQDNCKIVALDHEDDFKPRLVNTSVRELFAFLTIYKDFGNNLRQLRGDDAFIDSNFTDEELDELLSRFKLVDNEALSNDNTFWSQEIETFKANRVA